MKWLTAVYNKKYDQCSRRVSAVLPTAANVERVHVITVKFGPVQLTQFPPVHQFTPARLIIKNGLENIVVLKVE